ncbi:MAG: hypothetical protein SGJ10_01160 [Bacteroidota bacterium]|nr:hypothetical protein [Bacteroidota bacterium]
MKKIIIIIYMLFASAAFVQTQKMNFAVGFGPAAYNIKSANNAVFFNAYNANYTNILSKPFDTTIAAPVGWQSVISFALGKKALYYCSITVNKLKSDNRATFINND